MLIQKLEPPRARFMDLSELLKLRQGKRDVQVYDQLMRHLASYFTFNTVHEHTLVYVFIHDIANDLVNICLLHLELDMQNKKFEWRNRRTAACKRIMKIGASIIFREDRRAEVQNQWTSPT